MRRALVLAVCVGLVASTASAGPKAAAVRYQCGAKAMTFYFWPQGHDPVPALNAPAFKTPHLEAYTAKGAFNAFVDASGNQAFAKSCKKAPDLAARFAGKKKKTITTTQAVNCKFPSKADLKASKTGGGGLLSVIVGHTTQLALLASLKATGSTLTFDTRYCKAGPSPAQTPPMKYAFSGLTASFTLGPGAPITYALSGEVCGDPTTTPWTISVSLNGRPTSTPSVGLPDATPTDVTSIVFKDQSGAEVAKASIQLTFTKGPPPTMAMGVVPTGTVTNIQVSPPASVSATPVASC